MNSSAAKLINTSFKSIDDAFLGNDMGNPCIIRLWKPQISYKKEDKSGEKVMKRIFLTPTKPPSQKAFSFIFVTQYLFLALSFSFIHTDVTFSWIFFFVNQRVKYWLCMISKKKFPCSSLLHFPITFSMKQKNMLPFVSPPFIMFPHSWFFRDFHFPHFSIKWW